MKQEKSFLAVENIGKHISKIQNISSFIDELSNDCRKKERKITRELFSGNYDSEIFHDDSGQRIDYLKNRSSCYSNEMVYYLIKKAFEVYAVEIEEWLLSDETGELFLKFNCDNAVGVGEDKNGKLKECKNVKIGINKRKEKGGLYVSEVTPII